REGEGKASRSGGKRRLLTLVRGDTNTGGARSSPSRKRTLGGADAREGVRTVFVAVVISVGIDFAPEDLRARSARRPERVTRGASSDMRRLKVLLADDHRLMLRVMRLALEEAAGFDIVGEATSGSQVLPIVAQ